MGRYRLVPTRMLFNNFDIVFVDVYTRRLTSRRKESNQQFFRVDLIIIVFVLNLVYCCKTYLHWKNSRGYSVRVFF